MAPNNQADMVGRVVGGTYRILAPLSEGGMGSVYVAEHVRFGRKFAIKFLGGDLVGNEEAFARFRREAEIAGRLGHPNIVEVVDFNVTQDGIPYLVMELLEGKDLARHLQENGPFRIDEALDILEQVADAIEAAHAAGVVHRDLKPQNIFLTRRGNKIVAKVLDFGISKIQGTGAGLTRTNTIMGTPNYMSPEQAQGRVHEIDSRTDVFALGCIAYEMLTGRPPFPGDVVPTVLYKVCFEDPVDVRELMPYLPEQVSQVMAKALAKKREERYASAKTFIADLRRAATGLPPGLESGRVFEAWDRGETTAPLTVSSEMASVSTGPFRRTGVLLGIAAGVLVLLGGGAALWYLFGRGTHEDSSSGPAEARPARPAPRQPARPAPRPREAKKDVTIRVVVLPAKAKPTIFMDNRPVPGAREESLKDGKRALVAVVTLPRSDTRLVPMRVTAPGYQDATFVVTPSQDKEIKVSLWPLEGVSGQSGKDRRGGRRRRGRHRTSVVVQRPAPQQPARPSPPRPAARPRPRRPHAGAGTDWKDL